MGFFDEQTRIFNGVSTSPSKIENLLPIVKELIWMLHGLKTLLEMPIGKDMHCGRERVIEVPNKIKFDTHWRWANDFFFFKKKARTSLY